MNENSLTNWYMNTIYPRNQELDSIKADSEQRRNQRAFEHQSYQSPYQQFQSQYPQIDEYGRDVVSGRRFQQTMGDVGQALNNTTAIAKGEMANTEPNVLDYLGVGGMTAFHGSPHKFSKFSMDSIGTGEGAQAYGHGLYFAENPKVAGEYQKALSKTDVREVTYKNKAILDEKGLGTPD